MKNDFLEQVVGSEILEHLKGFKEVDTRRFAGTGKWLPAGILPGERGQDSVWPTSFKGLPLLKPLEALEETFLLTTSCLWHWANVLILKVTNIEGRKVCGKDSKTLNNYDSGE